MRALMRVYLRSMNQAISTVWKVSLRGLPINVSSPVLRPYFQSFSVLHGEKQERLVSGKPENKATCECNCVFHK